ncbi:hypothetical protein J6590_076613 [Homalodisca vitripennis]|nr:hypothetical protein J6590_076613 [Homalodisca vitripennis]
MNNSWRASPLREMTLGFVLASLNKGVSPLPALTRETCSELDSPSSCPNYSSWISYGSGPYSLNFTYPEYPVNPEAALRASQASSKKFVYWVEHVIYDELTEPLSEDCVLKSSHVSSPEDTALDLEAQKLSYRSSVE